jgi:hypothetical protein
MYVCFFSLNLYVILIDIKLEFYVTIVFTALLDFIMWFFSPL